ncbi:hypothetical protein [Rhodopirellula sp. MGV]|uniref:hypothetical protein n=1 Tax=Rhodopirellula sp. MGV TaxID=2023130 RepID=UPI00117B1C22|nr:hypothetical protein [Rhodopirellula sp. MGV]
MKIIFLAIIACRNFGSGNGFQLAIHRMYQIVDAPHLSGDNVTFPRPRGAAAPVPPPAASFGRPT